jgi:hypothetical protein
MILEHGSVLVNSSISYANRRGTIEPCLIWAGHSLGSSLLTIEPRWGNFNLKTFGLKVLIFENHRERRWECERRIE